jgi:tetratricopeptide (TPR) repeat protein
MHRLLALPLIVLLVVMPVRSSRAECPRGGAREAADLANQGDALRTVDPRGASDRYRAALAKAPLDARIFYKLALVHVTMNAWLDAAAAAGEAAKLAPKHADYPALRGAALARAGAYPEARQALEAAVALDPRHGEAHFELAEVLHRLRDLPGALAHYTKAIEARPGEGAYYAALADLYARLGYLDAAAQTVREGLRLTGDGPSRFALASLRGQVLEEKNDRVGALAAYEDARRACGPCNEPGQRIAFFNLGMAYGTAAPPRKAEAVQNLATFYKLACKGADSARYADPCAQGHDMVDALAVPLQ